MSTGQYFSKGITFEIVSASDFARSQKSLRTSPKIKILRQYRIPVGDPPGTLSAVGLINKNMRRIYTTLKAGKSHSFFHCCFSSFHVIFKCWVVHDLILILIIRNYRMYLSYWALLAPQEMNPPTIHSSNSSIISSLGSTWCSVGNDMLDVRESELESVLESAS